MTVLEAGIPVDIRMRVPESKQLESRNLGDMVSINYFVVDVY